MNIFPVLAGSHVFCLSQIDHVIDLWRLKALFAKFKDNITAVDRRMNNDMSQQFAEIILFWLALARPVSGDDIEALFVKPAK